MTSSSTIRGLASGAALAIATGCAAFVTSPLVGGNATLDVSPAIAGTGQKVQALVEPYTAADIDHLLVKVYKLDGSTEKEVLGTNQAPLAKDIAGDALATPVRFRNLHFDSSYRIRGYAYKAAGTDPADLISVDESSFFDIALTNDDRPDVATLSVQLVDKPFNAKGSASIEVHAGELYNEGPETFGVPVGLAPRAW